MDAGPVRLGVNESWECHGLIKVPLYLLFLFDDSEKTGQVRWIQTFDWYSVNHLATFFIGLGFWLTLIVVCKNVGTSVKKCLLQFVSKWTDHANLTTKWYNLKHDTFLYSWFFFFFCSFVTMPEASKDSFNSLSWNVSPFFLAECLWLRNILQPCMYGMFSPQIFKNIQVWGGGGDCGSQSKTFICLSWR